MHWSRLRRWVILGVIVVLPACSSAPKRSGPSGPRAGDDPRAERFLHAEAAAKLGSATPEGRDYIRSASSLLGPEVDRLTRHCMKAAPLRTSGLCKVVFRVGSDGHVSETYVVPSTPNSECIKSGIGNLVFPRPPGDSFWSSIEVQSQVRR
jgi:hypothetical protein